MPRISFEAASSIAEDAASHLVSSRSQMLLLSQSVLLHYGDRFYHDDGSDLSAAELQQIEDWASTAEHELMLVTSGSTPEIPTPFWDDSTDTDDEYPVSTEPWYGYVEDADAAADELTFVENAAIWAFTGLLAVSATPAAAILFNTSAPSFVLAMRGESFAEVIRVLVDAHDQVEFTTSGDPDELFQIPLVGDPSVGTHDIMVILRAIP